MNRELEPGVNVREKLLEAGYDVATAQEGGYIALGSEKLADPTADEAARLLLGATISELLDERNSANKPAIRGSQD